MSLLQMSFAGAMMILVITIIRALAINLLPKKTFLALWGIAVARLLLPFSLPSMFSVYSLIGNHTAKIATTKVPQISEVLPIEPIGQMATMPSDIGNITSTVSVWRVVWAAGMLVCAMVFAVAYWKCQQEFQTSLPVENDFIKSWLNAHQQKRPISIRQSNRFSAPLTYGVFHPVILMPTSTDWKNTKALQYVLAHEYIHIRRFDSITKLVLIAALCVHWFNPLVWVMYTLANRDIELSCDEAVVRLFGETTKAAYARALISMEETRSGLTPMCNNFSKNAIEERITAIMKIKKASILSLVLAFALVIGVTTAFATSTEEAGVKNDNKNFAAPDTTQNGDTVPVFCSIGDLELYENVEVPETDYDGVEFSSIQDFSPEKNTDFDFEMFELGDKGEGHTELAPGSEMAVGSMAIGKDQTITVSVASQDTAEIEVGIKSSDMKTVYHDTLQVNASDSHASVAIPIIDDGEYILYVKNTASVNTISFDLSYFIH